MSLSNVSRGFSRNFCAFEVYRLTLFFICNYAANLSIERQCCMLFLLLTHVVTMFRFICIHSHNLQHVLQNTGKCSIDNSSMNKLNELQILQKINFLYNSRTPFNETCKCVAFNVNIPDIYIKVYPKTTFSVAISSM